MNSNPNDDQSFPDEPLVQPDDDNRAGGPFPPFDDPAHSPGPDPEPQTPTPEQPSIDTRYAGHPHFSQDAASNTPPEGIGNSEPVDDVDEKTRHSDGQNRATLPTTNPDPQKLGAGPAIAEHSKDAWEKPGPSGDDPAEYPPNGEPGTTDQKPRWEGPPENRPRGYLRALDDPEVDRDAAGENLADPEKSNMGDALKTRGDR
jgi:hypothetical protein